MANFVCGVMLGILHGHSRLSLSLPCNQAFAMSPRYVRRYVRENGLTKPKRNVKKCLLEKCLEFLPVPKIPSSVSVVEASAIYCKEYLKGRYGNINLVLTSPPYLNRQTYIKDSWLRLWFLGRNSGKIHERSLETGSVIKFKESLGRMLKVIMNGLASDGYAILVCGEVKASIKGKPETVRVSDICLSILHDANFFDGKLVLDAIIRDRKMMRRGSYFAVHAGKESSGNENLVQRYGEERLLILRARR